MRAGFLYDRALSGLRLGDSHPFRPDRARRCRELCDRYGLLDPPTVVEIPPSPANVEELTPFHDKAYLSLLEQAAGIARLAPPTVEMLAAGIGSQDNPIFPELWDFVTRSTGATLEGARLVLAGDLEVAFNPVGGFHHGFPSHAEGFCYQNDIVLAALLALETDRRVAVVDIDAHHGNGTQAAFWKDPRVLTLSLHQDGRTIYPRTGAATEVGEGPGRHFTVNVPLAPGADDEIFVQAFDQVVPRALDAFRPHLLILQMGADMHRDDPLTNLRMTNRSHRHAVKSLARLSLPILALGGGGYHPTRTVRTWTLAWAELTGQEPEDSLGHAVGGSMYGEGSGSLVDDPLLFYDQAKEDAHAALEKTLEVLEPVLLGLDQACAAR